MDDLHFMVVWTIQRIPFVYEFWMPPMGPSEWRGRALHHAQQVIHMRATNLQAGGHPPEEMAIANIFRVGSGPMDDVTPAQMRTMVADLYARKKERGLPCADDIDPNNRSALFVRPLGQWTTVA